MVAAVCGKHFATPGVVARHAHRMLDGLGATVGEEHLVQGSGRALGDQAGKLAAHVVGEGGGNGGQPTGLTLDRFDQTWMLVSQVEIDQLRGEVQVLLAGVVPECRARTTGDRQRVDHRLRGP
ncbi:Uncharacterised protein [Mycobacteroides abscessus]|nr:Uncharacterised protein [Mycobacteroides abscessus]